MIAKLHAKGRSFIGLGQYILHDKDRADTSERVEWSETRNLATQNPHVAVRVMAATAMDAARLKREAGIKATGRKSADSVLHLTLSWRADETKDLSREEMMRAAHGAIRALGADDRQALIVSHNDEKHPHVHLAINRVSQQDGRLLPSSKEKLNLSRWAERYERERGEILCENRVINNAARDRGEYTRGEPDKPRHIYELEAANDNAPNTVKIRAEQKKLDLALARKTRKLKERHARQSADLVAAHRAKRAEIKTASRREALKSRDRVRAEFRPRWEERFHEHQAELRAFEKREDQLLGRVSNALRAVDFGAIFSGKDRRAAVLEAYNAMSTSGGRLEAFKRLQLARDRALEREQRAAETAAIDKIKADTAAKLVQQREGFKAERASTSLRHDLERAGERAEWKARGKQRESAFEMNHLKGKAIRHERAQVPDDKQAIDPNRDIDYSAKVFKQMRERRRRDRDRGEDHER